VVCYSSTSQYQTDDEVRVGRVATLLVFMLVLLKSKLLDAYWGITDSLQNHYSYPPTRKEARQCKAQASILIRGEIKWLLTRRLLQSRDLRKSWPLLSRQARGRSAGSARWTATRSSSMSSVFARLVINA
jgi:hypothetical protein